MRSTTRNPPRGSRRSAAAVAAAAVLGGVALGAVDLLAQLVLPYPWADLANSSATWAVAAFALGAWARSGAPRCMLAASVGLVLAVESYYLAAVVFLDDDPAMLLSPVNFVWAAFGVLAGCVFGFAGHLRAVRGVRLAALGTAVPVAVLLSEAATLVTRDVNPLPETALVEVCLAVVLAAVAGRGLHGKAVSLVLAVPLAVLGWFAFRLGGFGV